MCGFDPIAFAGTHALLASGNQESIHLTGRYRDSLPARLQRRVEFRTSADGVARVSGFPSGPLRQASGTQTGIGSLERPGKGRGSSMG